MTPSNEAKDIPLREWIEDKFEHLESVIVLQNDASRRDRDRHSKQLGQQRGRIDKIERVVTVLAILIILHTLADASPILLDLIKGLM